MRPACAPQLCCRSAALAGRRCSRLRAAGGDSPGPAKKDDSAISRLLDVFPSLGEGVGSSASLLLWAGFLAYALLLSPNQTPKLDEYFVKKLVGLERDDIPINLLYTCVFNSLGVYPLVFTALLQPSGRSGNKVPAWPFTTASFGLGFFALGLYFALWTPSAEVTSPPTQEQTAGLRNFSTKLTESAITAVLLLLVVLGLYGTAALAATDSKQWLNFFQLFEESRLVHVSTLDFIVLTAVAPFWMANDAQKRRWEGRQRLLPLLSAVPLLGPAIYLVLRPKAS